MKKFLSALVLSIIISSFNFCSAKDIWIYDYPNGNSLYMVYESVVYGYRTNFYAYFNIKRVNSAGNLIRTEKWNIGHDEGDYYYSIDNEKNSRRAYDNADSTAVLNWLRDHEKQARPTANQFQRVLSD